MKILILGGSGFIGTNLKKALEAKGHSVVVASLRQRHSGWESELMRCDAVVNLAGEPIFGKRWNIDVKAAIYDSRVEGTRRVVTAMGAALKNGGGSCRTLVNASAVGYYGATGPEALDENSPAGPDFLAFVCRDWEAEAMRAETEFGIRTAVVRTGIVLDRHGGALQKLWLPFSLGLGGPLGILRRGRQGFSWIHLEDIVGIYVHAIENSQVRGPLNGTAPEVVSNGEFSKAFGRALHRPALFPLPGPVLYAMVGEASHFLLTGQYVYPKRTLESGYAFRHPKLAPALENIVRS